MAVGDLLILQNSNNTDVVPNAGSSLDLLWNDTIQSFGLGAGSASTNGQVSLGAGRYLIGYSEYFNTTNTTNNERVEIQGEIHSVANGREGGFGQGMIRKSSGDQDCVVRGSMILDLASATSVFIRVFRQDNSTSGTVDRVTGLGQLYILQLDTTHNYGLYSKTATQNLTGTTTSTVTFPTTDVQDTGFSIASNVVTVSAAGRYLVTYSVDLSQGATGREDVIGYLRNGGAEITGTRSFCYLRGADNNVNGALTWIGVLDLSAGSTIDLRAQCPTSATISLLRGNLQFWQLPSGNETVIMEATNGNYNANGNFQFDTVEHIDSAEFTASGATDTIGLDNGNVYLAFATLSQTAPDTVQRAVPRFQFELDGSLVGGVGDGYHRNSGGTGYLAITASSAFYANDTSSDLRLNITVTAAAGTLTNDLGQFSVLSLGSIFGDYVPPPTITQVDGGDNQVLIGQTGVLIDGARFEALQGTGGFELWSDAVGTIQVAQTVNSWSDGQLSVDIVQGALTDETNVFGVVTTDGGETSPPFQIFLGIPPLDDYFTVISDTAPDHWWRFNNDAYADSAGANPITSSVIGDGGAFVATPICEQNTHSWQVTGGVGARRECANSPNMNTSALQTRSMAGWIRVGGVDPALSCLYEEGGGVNNIALFLGLGNVLIASYADTGDDNAQAYSDFPLVPGRDYYYTWSFDHTEGTSEFRLWIDGVLQSVTFGNPLTSGDLDSHPGDISFGGPGGNLEVGGTDVLFRTQLDTYYANWCSWRVKLSDSQITELFQRGARPQVTISADTAANMQTAVDALADTAYGNHALTLRIEQPSDGINLSLDFDNITFDAATSIQVEWRGGGALTITNLNGANTDAAQCVSARGGSVAVVNPALLTLSGLEDGTEVRVYQAGTTTEIGGIESTSGGTFALSVQVSAVDIVIHAIGFLNQKLENVDTSSGDVSLPIQQRVDRQYENP